MSDFYTEQLVKKRPDMKDLAIKVGLILITVIAFLIVLVFPIGIILPILAIVLDVIMFRRLNVEYEYLYVNGDLDVDKIMSRAKRKRMFPIECIGDGASCPGRRTGTSSVPECQDSGFFFGNRAGKALYPGCGGSRRVKEGDIRAE